MTNAQSTVAEPRHIPELLAPAGDLESAYAAFQYGADAVYVGLRRFSARAEASNFSADDLGEITSFAHAATPRRRVFAAVNTLVQNRELAELVDTVAVAAESDADALIVQDLGVAYIAKKHFPTLRLHGSTQMAVHSLAGAQALRDIGFKRVTLARELTLEEVSDIAANAGIEVEVFIHGALCYSYSGLCLYSSLMRTGSGNRGRCAYPCRDIFEAPVQAGSARFPFSMKDLAFAESVTDLTKAGVACLKIEGRKKSALYVASTTAYYHALLAGKSTQDSRRQTESDMKTIFSRPWTRLYLRSRRNPDVVDTDVVGHRGAPIGKITGISHPHTDLALLRFTTQRRLERHDGIQLDVQGGRPYGFSIEAIGLKDERTDRFKNVFEAPAGTSVGIPLPTDHPPLEVGMIVYCSSSQHVKQKYRNERPRPGQYRSRRPVDVTISVQPELISATATINKDALFRKAVSASGQISGRFDVARKASVMGDTFRDAFTKLGDTGLQLDSLVVKNQDNRFVPVSILNNLRRDLTTALDRECSEERARTITGIKAAISHKALCAAKPDGNLEWSIKVAHAHALSGLQGDDWAEVAEAVIDISKDPLPSLVAGLQKLEATIGRDRIRLALPAIARRWEVPPLEEKIAALSNAGWHRWEFANISGLRYLSNINAKQNEARGNLATDWSVYILNRVAALQVLELGAVSFVLSPEDDFENIKSLLAEFGKQAIVPVYQDTPLFISETCPKAGAVEACTTKCRTCKNATVELRSSAKEEVTVLEHECRTVVIGRQPFNLVRFIDQLKRAGAGQVRADFSWKPFGPAQVASTMKALRSGTDSLPGHTGNFERRLM